MRLDTATDAKLNVRFAPTALSFLSFAWGDYWIAGLAARAQGFDTSKLVRTASAAK